MDYERTGNLVDKNLLVLGEHFDNIVFLASRVNSLGQTERYFKTIGNSYANKGACDEFITTEKELEIANCYLGEEDDL